MVHTHEGVADSFLADLREIAAELMADPDKKCTEGVCVCGSEGRWVLACSYLRMCICLSIYRFVFKPARGEGGGGRGVG